MSLHERITEALNGTSDPPWGYVSSTGEIVDGYVQHVAQVRTIADSRLIASAPGLLAEAAQRLNFPVDAVPSLVAELRDAADADELLVTDHLEFMLRRAADLLAQAFLEETP